MARDLAQIVSELDASYNPQRQTINQQLGALPGQADSEIQGLQATQNQAFDDILGGARDRGLGFSGIPLGEQAKYTASTFLPAVAKVKQAQEQSKTSLYDALNNLNLDQNKYAQNIRQSELDRDEQQRQFNESLKAKQAQNAGLSGLSLGGNSSSPTAPQQTAPKTDDKTNNAAYADVKNLLSKDGSRIQQEYEAIKKSASYGNAYDKIKQALIEQLYPTAKNFGKNTVAISGYNSPAVVRLAPQAAPISYGVANQGSIRL